MAMAAGTAQAASQTGYSVTIGATGTAYNSIHGKIYGYALAAYQAKGHATGTISGTVSGAAAGDAVTLLAKPFKAGSFAATGQSTTLATDGTSAYSFAVTPTLATAYEVRVSTGTTVDATSATATVYVEGGGHGGRLHERCSRTSCTYSYPVYNTFPASAYRTESKKRVYFYLAQWRSSKHPASWFYLARKDKASKPNRIGSGEFEQTLTWYITLSAGRYFIPLACTRDAESTDGLGLPGRHGCGSKRVSIRAGHTYLG